jgi:hypothetical protein
MFSKMACSFQEKWRMHVQDVSIVRGKSAKERRLSNPLRSLVPLSACITPLSLQLYWFLQWSLWAM